MREHQLSAADLIQPLFVVHGARVEREIGSMPGVFQLSVDQALNQEVDRIRSLGIPAVLLFGSSCLSPHSCCQVSLTCDFSGKIAVGTAPSSGWR